MRVTKLKTSRKRITNRGKKRTATTITFRLSQPARLVLVFRGPGPSCDVAGRLRVLGLAGLNRVRFAGTIRKRRLEPGTYLLVTRLKEDPTPLARTHLTIVDPRAPNAPRVLPDCTPPTPFQLAFPHAALSPLGGTFTPAPGQPTAQKPEAAAGDDDDGNVLEAQTPPLVGLPEAAPTPGEDAPGTVALLLAALLVASLLVSLVVLAANAFSRAPRV